MLLGVVWLRQYPTPAVLGDLFGLSDRAVRRIVERVLPLLEQAGRAAMLLPRPTPQRSRRTPDALLPDVPERAEVPGRAVLANTFEQPVQRPPERAAADAHYSGHKKRHTLKSQAATDQRTGPGWTCPRARRGRPTT